MKVLGIVSFFRNAERSGQTERFLSQVAFLRDVLKDRFAVRVYAVWGDSTDMTPHLLMRGAERRLLRLTLIERSHGGPPFPSDESAARLKALSWVGNGGLEAVEDDVDYVLYVESDLLWDPDTITHLLGLLEIAKRDFSRPADDPTGWQVGGYKRAIYDTLPQPLDILAPAVVAGPPYKREDTGGEFRDVFYDIFVFRKDGRRFSPFWPYHADVALDKPTHVDSAGSCLVMTGDAARRCRIIEDNALLGFCKDAWAKGFGIACDLRVKVRQP